MKTSELTGPALDWAVAKCGFIEGTAQSLIRAEVKPYSTSWQEGGPIIERERIDVTWHIDHWTAMWWADNSGMAKDQAQRFKHNRQHSGPTPLIAAMRCFVASRLGDEVDISDELLG